MSRSQSEHDDDRGAAQQECIIFGSSEGQEIEPCLVKKRKLGTHYDLYEKASSEPEKLQNQSVFQLKSVSPHISPNLGFTIFVVRERSREVEFRKSIEDLAENCSATLILRHTRRKSC